MTFDSSKSQGESEEKLLVAATGNKHKVRELEKAISLCGWHLRSVNDFGGMPEPVEDGDTFAENAIKKASFAAAFFDRPALADDSGLSVLALAGDPGVFSARYAGPAADDRQNIVKLLDCLKGKKDRRAFFSCVLAVSFSPDDVRTVEGRVDGWITESPRGTGGFGYDPVFIPAGYDKTFAELPASVKNRISHRARALQALKESGVLS